MISLTRLLLGLYFAFNIFLLGHAVHSSNFDFITLSFLIGTPFVLYSVLTIQMSSIFLSVFSLIAMTSAWFSPLSFFHEKTHYTFGGFNAVRHFDFSVSSYINDYTPIIFAFALILLIGAIPNILELCGARKTDLPSPKEESGTVPGTAFWARSLLFISLIIFALVHWFMFENSVGIVGVIQKKLPFKLTGILNYASKFLFPLTLILITRNLKLKIIDILAILAFASFASVTTCSRKILLLNLFPIFIPAFLKRDLINLIITSTYLNFYFPVVLKARNYIFFVYEGESIRNPYYKLSDVFYNLATSFSLRSILEAPLAFFARIGGGQDVALAAQYDNTQIAGTLKEFIRLYFFDYYELTRSAQTYMYSFDLAIKGYSPGDGGFFAHLLMVSNGSYANLIFLSLFLGLVLLVGNWVSMRLAKANYPSELIFFYSIIFNVLFFIFSNPLVFNAFFLLTAVFCLLNLDRYFSFDRVVGQLSSVKNTLKEQVKWIKI